MIEAGRTGQNDGSQILKVAGSEDLRHFLKELTSNAEVNSSLIPPEARLSENEREKSEW